MTSIPATVLLAQFSTMSHVQLVTFARITIAGLLVLCPILHPNLSKCTHTMEVPKSVLGKRTGPAA